MAVVTIYRLAEECQRLLSSGIIQAASLTTINELKIAIGQVANQLLKTEHFTINEKMQERIPNGSVIGLYEGITYTEYGIDRSKATLPIKPLKLPRNMGIFSVYLASQPSKEFIPLQIGQANLIQSQPLVNDLLGQVGYENYGMELIFTKNLKALFPTDTLSMRLAIFDISQYGDYDPLPITPELEWQIKQEVVKLYSTEGTVDKLVDSSVKGQQNLPLREQQQS